MRGATISSGRRNHDPDAQLVFCSGLALNRLNTSTNAAMRRPLAQADPLLNAQVENRDVIHPCVSIGSARIRTLPYVSVVENVRPKDCPTGDAGAA
jgi:hypothetical protein